MWVGQICVLLIQCLWGFGFVLSLSRKSGVILAPTFLSMRLEFLSVSAYMKCLLSFREVLGLLPKARVRSAVEGTPTGFRSATLGAHNLFC